MTDRLFFKGLSEVPATLSFKSTIMRATNRELLITLRQHPNYGPGVTFAIYLKPWPNVGRVVVKRVTHLFQRV